VAAHLYETLSRFFAAYGYWVVFFGVMLENCGIPIPGETALLFAGFLAYRGQLELTRVIVTAIVGATLGDSFGYVIGRFGGIRLIERLYLRFKPLARHYDKAKALCLRYGQWAVFVARFVAGLRVFSGILAGALGMPYVRFLVFEFAGAVVWGTVIAFVGYAFGNNWDRLLELLGRFDLVVIGLLVAGAILYFLYRRKRRRNPGD
jgi:membrane protein DedA with SNARE-associated domain